MAQPRLTAADGSRQQHACDSCRSRPCEICAMPVPVASNSKTCSPECKAERSRRYQLAYYHEIRATDDEDTAKRRSRSRARRAGMTPAERLEDSRKRAATEDKAAKNARARARHAERVASDPAYAAAKAASSERHAAKDPAARRESQRKYAQGRRARVAELDVLRLLGQERKPDGE